MSCEPTTTSWRSWQRLEGTSSGSNTKPVFWLVVDVWCKRLNPSDVKCVAFISLFVWYKYAAGDVWRFNNAFWKISTPFWPFWTSLKRQLTGYGFVLGVTSIENPIGVPDRWRRLTVYVVLKLLDICETRPFDPNIPLLLIGDLNIEASNYRLKDFLNDKFRLVLACLLYTSRCV